MNYHYNKLYPRSFKKYKPMFDNVEYIGVYWIWNPLFQGFNISQKERASNPSHFRNMKFESSHKKCKNIVYCIMIVVVNCVQLFYASKMLSMKLKNHHAWIATNCNVHPTLV